MNVSPTAFYSLDDQFKTIKIIHNCAPINEPAKRKKKKFALKQLLGKLQAMLLAEKRKKVIEIVLLHALCVFPRKTR